ncbi:3'-5' exonuclease [Shewanella sp.]|uniref:3'-5' exonuclease n=1 Tax=Shewanella sp. TaxID=50422 RepID=UPI000EE8AC28|nr:3'-5' exonuclease [Shewanella sp.]HCD15484.1 3'-5' exonuclease [Shewanella sp.]
MNPIGHGKTTLQIMRECNHAAHFAAQSWVVNDALIIDTETTGLDWGDEIVELSIIELRSGKVLLNTLVKPMFTIPPEAIAIHGISNEMVENAPEFEDIILDITELLSGRVVVAYNVAFDKKMLCSSASIFDSEPPFISCDFQCAMLAYAEYKGDWNHGHGDFKWHSLTNAAKQQGISIPGNPHRALYDCMLTRALILKMAEAAL